MLRTVCIGSKAKRSLSRRGPSTGAGWIGWKKSGANLLNCDLDPRSPEPIQAFKLGRNALYCARNRKLHEIVLPNEPEDDPHRKRKPSPG